MRASQFHASVAAVLLSTSVLALSPPDPATLENMKGAWRAVGSSGTQYRLVLDSQGHGQLGVRDRYSKIPTFLYDVKSVAFKGNEVRIQLLDVAKPAELLSLHGEGWPEHLVLAGEHMLGKAPIKFFPEVEWQDSEGRLRQEMRPQE